MHRYALYGNEETIGYQIIDGLLCAPNNEQYSIFFLINSNNYPRWRLSFFYKENSYLYKLYFQGYKRKKKEELLVDS